MKGQREWGISDQERKRENLDDNRLSEQNANCDSAIFFGRTQLKKKNKRGERNWVMVSWLEPAIKHCSSSIPKKLCLASQLLEERENRAFGMNSLTICSNWLQNVDKYIYPVLFLLGINLTFTHILSKKQTGYTDVVETRDCTEQVHTAT